MPTSGIDTEAPGDGTSGVDASLVRQRASWTRVLAICVLAFALWLLLFAPSLQHNAQVSPVGTRRTVALDILGPIADTSRVLQVSRIVSVTDRVTGRTGNRPGDGAASSISVIGPHHHVGHLHPPPHHGQGHSGGPGPGTTPTSVPVSDLTHPTAAHPLRVLIVGDSLGIDMGGPLQNDLANTGVAVAALDARESTGLTRPDYFNWPVQLAADLKSSRPQVVVIMMGANDPQDFLGPPDVPYSSPRWNPMYAARVGSFMQEAESAGAVVIWVGMPPMQNPVLSSEMADIDALDKQQAALAHPPINFLSSWTLLGTKQGTYTPFITNASGQEVNVRTPDGTHLTPAGGEVLSQAVLNFLRGPLHIDLP
jgi:lysophospholipase L1-like esterase